MCINHLTDFTWFIIWLSLSHLLITINILSDMSNHYPFNRAISSFPAAWESEDPCSLWNISLWNY